MKRNDAEGFPSAAAAATEETADEDAAAPLLLDERRHRAALVPPPSLFVLQLLLPRNSNKCSTCFPNEKHSKSQKVQSTCRFRCRALEADLGWSGMAPSEVGIL